jgi:intracellular sulfur oxidation DsrE/DsrF family protein
MSRWSRWPRFLAALFASLLLLLATTQSAGAQSAGAGNAPKTRVVMQVSDDDPGKWNLAMGNARNLQKALGAANVDIEIVVFGPGIGMLKAASPVAARVREANADGIALNACENTMAGQNLKKEDMNPAAGYVPYGVVEIVRKQQAGYAYLRP